MTDMTQNVEQVMRTMRGFIQSKYNVVIFKDDPWLWTQYYLGLFFNKPTLVILCRADQKKYFKLLLRKPLVKAIFIVETMDEAHSSEIADRLAKYVKENKDNDL